MPRYSEDFTYRDAPPNRWDADRLARERDYRDSAYYDDYYGHQEIPPPRRSRPAAPVAPVYETQRYYEDDYYGPRGTRAERRYFEEDDYADPRARQGQVIPFRPGRPSRPQAPPRPGQLLRRQSSLDTFDRPPRRFPPRMDFDVADPPSPRDNRYRSRPSRREVYEEYDDIQVQDPDYYGDDGFREYREREWIRSRRRESESRSHSRERPAPPPPADDRKSVVEEKEETIIDDHRSEATRVSKKEIIIGKTKKEEKPYPRRGKTKMPKRLVHTKVLFDLGYSFYEEGEKTIIIEKALGPDNIDEIFVKSKQYREQEVSTTKLLEAPPAPSGRSRHGSMRAPSPPASVVRERKSVVTEEIKTKPLSEAPRSVREWDNMTAKSSGTRHSRSHRSRRSKSVVSSRSSSPESVHETIIEKKTTIVERSPSPERPPRASRSRARSRARSRRRDSVDETEIIERRIVREEDDFGFEESASINLGPVALLRDMEREKERRLSRSRSRPYRDRVPDIEREIELLRAERREDRRDDRRERVIERDGALIIARSRSRSRSLSPFNREIGELKVERRGDELVEVRKERLERSRSRPPAPPSSRLIRGMMYATT